MFKSLLPASIYEKSSHLNQKRAFFRESFYRFMQVSMSFSGDTTSKTAADSDEVAIQICKNLCEVLVAI